MDSQERHELKENDLATFFANFGQWWEKWGNIILVVAVVTLASVAVYRLVVSQRAAAQHEAWADLGGATSPESYLQVAQTHRIEAVRALGYLRAGEMFHDRAIQSATANASNDATPGPEADLQQAAAAYQRVPEVTMRQVFRANAYLGLGAVAESRQDWTAAETYYTQAAEAAGELYPSLAGQAQHRRALLETLQRPVAFSPETAGATAPDLSLWRDMQNEQPDAGSAFTDDVLNWNGWANTGEEGLFAEEDPQSEEQATPTNDLPTLGD